MVEIGFSPISTRFIINIFQCLNMKNPDSKITLATLANVNEIVRHITQEIMGNDLANSIGGSPLTRSMIYNLVQSRVRVNFSRFNGAL